VASEGVAVIGQAPLARLLALLQYAPTAGSVVQPHGVVPCWRSIVSWSWYSS
jgi:hypothetical protein